MRTVRRDRVLSIFQRLYGFLSDFIFIRFLLRSDVSLTGHKDINKNKITRWKTNKLLD